MLGEHPSEPEQNSTPFGRRQAEQLPRLLVIDDDQIHRMIICRIGDRAGFSTSDAIDPVTAGALVSEYAFDVATLDLSLGQRAGSEVLAVFSRLKVAFPIIIISGSDPEVANHAFNLGRDLELDMSAPITKPVDLTKLRETLTAIGAGWRSRHPDNCPAKL